MAGDVVLQTSPVVKERETVMGLVTEVNMTDMLAVLEISSVEVIIVNSLAIIITRKMTAVRSPNFLTYLRTPSLLNENTNLLKFKHLSLLLNIQKKPNKLHCWSIKCERRTSSLILLLEAWNK